MPTTTPDPSDVPANLVARVAAACEGLPEVVHEAAWTGTRWVVRAKTFAHLVLIDAGWPPAYVAAAGTEGPAVVLMVRSSGEELAALRLGGPPCFAPPWRADEVGAFMDELTDDELRHLVRASYRLRAPRSLARLVPEG